MYNDSLITGKVIKSGILRSVNHFGSYVNSLVDGPEYNDRTVASLREYNMVDTATANAMEVHSAVINNNVPVVRKNVLARDSYKYKFMSYLGFHNDDSDSLYTAVAFNNFEVSRLLIQEKKFPVNCTIFCNDQISTMVECKTINSVLTVKFPKNIRLDKAGCLSKVSLLTMACENNNSDLVKLLLNNGAEIDNDLKLFQRSTNYSNNDSSMQIIESKYDLIKSMEVQGYTDIFDLLVDSSCDASFEEYVREYVSIETID